MPGEAQTGLPPADQGTAGAALSAFPTIESDTATTLVARAGWLRSHADIVRNDADDLHHEIQNYDLDQRAAAKGRHGVPSLLQELAAERGMAWADIARLVGVSVGAVRKWRREGGASADNRLELARLAAFLDLLAEYAIEDPAQWMEMRLPLPAGYVVTPMDLYRQGAVMALLDYASQRRTAEQILDQTDSSWRERRSDFEVYVASDGDKAVRVKTRD
jgi:transcriptional regulator with XRE-family HTH domain